MIRKITGGTITTVAGTGQGGGYGGDGGPATSRISTVLPPSLWMPRATSTSPTPDNNLIRKVDTNGIITSYHADRSHRHCGWLEHSQRPWFDPSGALYIADSNNSSRGQIRRPHA